MSKTCGTDAQNGAVRMRSTEFGGKTFFELKIKCVEHLRGYSSISKSAHFADTSMIKKKEDLKERIKPMSLE